MTTVKGTNGTISFDGRTVSISRTGMGARIAFGKGEKHIPVRQISAVQVKPNTLMTKGFIQFSLAGGSEKNAMKGRRTMTALEDENSVVFPKKVEADMLALRDEIEQAITNGDNDPAAQLGQLAALHSQGIISDTEFAAKKADLLSRM